jgi:predicted HTH domain antitoxin
MMKNILFKPVALEIPLFKEIEQKEQFLFVLGALVTRLISLQKAAEMMEIEPDMFLKILELMGIEFSYLSENDVLIEREGFLL